MGGTGWSQRWSFGFFLFFSWSFAFWKARVGHKHVILPCFLFLFFLCSFWSFALWKARFGQKDGLNFDEEEDNGDDVDCAPELCCFCLELNQLSQQCLYGLAKS